jgi:hypothetical protein
MTLIEVLVASLLAALLMAAVFRTLDVTLDLWARGEVRRALVEQTTATGELLAADLTALHNGQQGDLLVEWVPFDTDGDDVVDRLWPRLRFVRQAGAAEVARLTLAGLTPEELRALDNEGLRPEDVEDVLELDLPDDSGLLEVAWVVLPAAARGEGRFEGLLWRGERLVGGLESESLLHERFFNERGLAPVGALREVTGGVLWVGLQFATQTSLLRDGWTIGSRLRDTSASWDAWNRARPDVDAHRWNLPGAGMPAVGDTPLLPRRVRVELEFERPADRKRRTTLVEPIEAALQRFEVENGDRLPREAEAHLLIDGEWMVLKGVDGDHVRVERGARGTQPKHHPAGALVHHGARLVTEIPVPLYNDDWNL